MTILVTGAAGFIGSHVTDSLLADGHEVIGLDSFDDFYGRAIKDENLVQARDHASFRLVEGDIRNAELVRGLPDDIDAVIHLAARAGVRPSIAQPVLYTDVNVMGTAVILELVRERGTPSFIFASSSSVYGNTPTVPFSEDHPVDHPISPYAATKKSGELLCHAHHHLHGTACLCLRFFTVYGPRQRPDLAIRKFSRLLLAGEPLPRFGDGSTARDYTFISDIVQGVRGALDYSQTHPECFEIVNLGESQTIRLSRMIETLSRVFDREPVIDQKPPQPGDVDRTFADISRARALLGYDPRVDFDEGIERFARWYRATGARQDTISVE